MNFELLPRAYPLADRLDVEPFCQAIFERVYACVQWHTPTATQAAFVPKHTMDCSALRKLIAHAMAVRLLRGFIPLMIGKFWNRCIWASFVQLEVLHGPGTGDPRWHCPQGYVTENLTKGAIPLLTVIQTLELVRKLRHLHSALVVSRHRTLSDEDFRKPEF